MSRMTPERMLQIRLLLSHPVCVHKEWARNLALELLDELLDELERVLDE